MLTDKENNLLINLKKAYCMGQTSLDEDLVKDVFVQNKCDFFKT